MNQFDSDRIDHILLVETAGNNALTSGTRVVHGRFISNT